MRDEPLEPVQSECSSSRGMLRRALGMYLDLPRKVQLGLLTLALAGVARLTGADAPVVRMLVFLVTGADAARVDQEKADQEALDAR